MPKHSKSQIAIQCNQIRRYINAGLSNADIVAQMNITRATFYNYLTRIRDEDYNDLMLDRKGNLAVAVNLTRDRLSRILRRLEIIANNGTEEHPMNCTPGEMIAAATQASMVSLALLKLEAQGPTIVHTDELQGIVEKDKVIRIDESSVRHLGDGVRTPQPDVQHVPESATGVKPETPIRTDSNPDTK